MNPDKIIILLTLVWIISSNSSSLGHYIADLQNNPQHRDLNGKMVLLDGSNKKWLNFVLDKLEQKGIQRSKAYKLLSHKNIRLQPRLIAANLGYVSALRSLPKPGSSSHSNQYGLSKRLFLERYGAFLKKVSEKYNISQEVILSILWVETRIGMDVGQYSVLNVYYNLTLLQHPEVFIKVLELVKRAYPNQSIFYIIKKAYLKGQWGLEELKSTIHLPKQGVINLQSLNGSFAGAFGIPQFIPSSYLRYAKDGNGDGVINLFNMKDAIESTANYLSRMGWSDSKQSRHQAILSYNNSRIYLNKVIYHSRKVYKDIYPPQMKNSQGLSPHGAIKKPADTLDKKNLLDRKIDQMTAIMNNRR
ncbi:MAG: hypothetical protein IEMM0008_0520 [bacterium]|nr:MAG: hypothetical protein IEMM0008_0520 [bacterium]